MTDTAKDLRTAILTRIGNGARRGVRTPWDFLDPLMLARATPSAWHSGGWHVPEIRGGWTEGLTTGAVQRSDKERRSPDPQQVIEAIARRDRKPHEVRRTPVSGRGTGTARRGLPAF